MWAHAIAAPRRQSCEIESAFSRATFTARRANLGNGDDVHRAVVVRVRELTGGPRARRV